MHISPRWAAPLLALSALLTSGCERVLFGVANQGFEQPDATVAFAPDRGLSVDIYRPAGTTRNTPVVVFFYGGAWTRGARAQYRFVGRQLARQGLLTLVADYRTYPRATFPGFMDDGARAVDWALRHAHEYDGDPRRLFLAGHSAGAQIAALLGTDARYLAAHGRSPAALAGVIGLSGPYDFNVGDKYRPIFGPEPQWPQAQAVNFVDGDEPPFLLVHGKDDRTVGVRQSEALARRLRAQNRQVTLLLLPGAGHVDTLRALRRPSRAPEVLQAIRAFVGQRDAANQ